MPRTPAPPSAEFSAAEFLLHQGNPGPMRTLLKKRMQPVNNRSVNEFLTGLKMLLPAETWAAIVGALTPSNGSGEQLTLGESESPPTPTPRKATRRQLDSIKAQCSHQGWEFPQGVDNFTFAQARDWLDTNDFNAWKAEHGDSNLHPAD